MAVKDKNVPNIAAELTKAMVSGEYDDDGNPNVSTEPLPKNEVLDTRSYQDAAAARAAIAPHMAYANTASDPSFSEKIKEEWQDLAGRMKAVKLPDLRVNVLGTKGDIAGSTFMHGNVIDHKGAVKVLTELCGAKRISQLKKLATRANQEHKPILWLGQQFTIELFQPYTHKIFQALQDSKIELPPMPDAEFARECIHSVFDYTVAEKLDTVALNNRMDVYPVFLYIFDMMLNRHMERLKVKAVASTWDAIKEYEENEAKNAA
jgi:flavodoxin